MHEDWELARIYCDIVSGTKKEKLPELQRLLKDRGTGRVQLVLTKSTSTIGSILDSETYTGDMILQNSTLEKQPTPVHPIKS